MLLFNVLEYNLVVIRELEAYFSAAFQVVNANVLQLDTNLFQSLRCYCLMSLRVVLILPLPSE